MSCNFIILFSKFCDIVLFGNTIKNHISHKFDLNMFGKLAINQKSHGI